MILPDGITPATARHLRATLRGLRADVLASIDEDGPTATAEAIDVGRSTLARWREPGGWLA